MVWYLVAHFASESTHVLEQAGVLPRGVLKDILALKAESNRKVQERVSKRGQILKTNLEEYINAAHAEALYEGTKMFHFRPSFKL